VPENRQGISPSDLRACGQIFTANGWPFPQRYFRYLAADDCWECWRVQADGTRTLVAKYQFDPGEWVEE
jgi:hypothetical protein